MQKSTTHWKEIEEKVKTQILINKHFIGTEMLPMVNSIVIRRMAPAFVSKEAYGGPNNFFHSPLYTLLKFRSLRLDSLHFIGGKIYANIPATRNRKFPTQKQQPAGSH